MHSNHCLVLIKSAVLLLKNIHKYEKLLIICFFSLLCSSNLAGADPDYLYHICPNTTTFAKNSLYEANRNSLLSFLSSNSTSSDYNYYNGFRIDSSGNQPDTVYGLFLCRGDVSNDVCKNCVGQAVQDMLQRCPLAKVAIIWYDYCLLRYSNESLFSVMEVSPMIYMWNTGNVTEEPDRFEALLRTDLTQTATEAASAPSAAKKFAMRNVNFTVFQTIYYLIQCTPDLSSSNCDRCLRIIISQFPNCCSGRPGGRVLVPSCNFRYEFYPFNNQTAVPAPPPPLVVVNGSLLPAAPPPPLVVGPGSQSPEYVSFPPPDPPPNKGRFLTAIKISAAVGGCVVLSCIGYCLLRRRAKVKHGSVLKGEDVSEMTTVESLQFGLKAIESATKKFSADNKLGRGGFGEVYKGTLPNGQEIAVKRLSKSSAQGAEEFKNEVLLVAKLQHRNLVRLLGYCLEGEEKILIYEYVPNKSLDYFLFDPKMQGHLDWSTCQKIIGGIARGILYLHEDSRLKIIHRDLKAGNILLDADMNPKISDFGMAKLFGVDQTEANTNRIMGTYGYMSPEYAMHGQFSVKSDVYSFGVLLLEIVSGKKNSSFYKTEGAEHLVSYVWKLWRDGRPLEALDPNLMLTHSTNEVVRFIQIGLLCVQEDPNERPTMATIVLMLNSSYIDLPLPKHPAFFIHGRIEQSRSAKGLELDQQTGKLAPISVDEAPITIVSAR